MIIANNIKKTFPTGEGTLEVLKGIDLEIKKGAYYAIMGESGVGKSTLLHLLGFLDDPTEGIVYFDGARSDKLTDDEKTLLRLNKIGFLFQRHHLLEDFTALENVALPAVAAGLNRTDAKKAAEKILEPLGLLPRKSHFPAQLSGGEAQRTALARALVNSPVVLYADEPAGSLDDETKENLMKYVQPIRELHNITIVIATHNRDVSKFADKILKMRDGRFIDNV